MEKTVSVIIPAYNVEKYIGKCLESVCAQSYSRLQVIVIDDGSTDDTLKQAQRFCDDYAVKIIHKENGGVSAARNMALDLVEGEYVLFLDADDTLEKDAIEILVNAIDVSESDWVSCQYSRWDEDGNRLKDYDFVSGDFAFSSDEDRKLFMTRTLLKYLIGFEVWGKIYKSEIIKSNGIRFSEKCKIGEDLAFNIKYLMCSNNLKCISERLVRYTVRDSSAMGTLNKLSVKIYENSLLLQDIWDFISKENRICWLQKFPCIFIRIMDNSYIGHSPIEVINAIQALSDTSFVRERYEEIDNSKTDILNMYSSELAKIKYRYHIYVRSVIDKRYTTDKIKIFFYDIYRIARGRESLKKWKIPY